jgi:hypothetical protein
MSNEGVVRVRWRDEQDSTGELTVDACTPTGFAGLGTAWFNSSAVAAFAERLFEYPLGDAPIELAGGRGPIGENSIQVGLAVYEVGGKGQVGIGIELARKPWDSPAMRPREQHRAAFEVLTTYQRLSEFAADLRHLLQGNIDVAEIGGEELL